MRIQELKVKLPKTLLHVAHSKDLSNIKKKGMLSSSDYILGDDQDKGVNLIKSVDDLYRPDRKEDVHLLVNTEGLTGKWSYMGSNWWRYHGNIPYSQIKIIKPLK